LPPTAALRAARRRLRRRLAPLRGAILLRAARAKYLYQYRKVAGFPQIERQNPYFKSCRSHRALRAPRGRSHNTHFVSTHVLSSPRGIGILAQSPRRDQRAGQGVRRVRRPRRTPPSTQPSHRVRTRHGSSAGSLGPPHSQYSLSSRSVEVGRVGNQWAAAVHPPSDRVTWGFLSFLLGGVPIGYVS